MCFLGISGPRQGSGRRLRRRGAPVWTFPDIVVEDATVPARVAPPSEAGVGHLHHSYTFLRGIARLWSHLHDRALAGGVGDAHGKSRS